MPRENVRRLGLERAWFAQVQVNAARNYVVRWILDNDQLFVLTSAGVVHSLNAHTGATLWTATAGKPGYPSLGPTAGDRHVALVNGSTLYVLDRHNGRPVLVRQVGGAPGASPALALNHVFVPLASGRIEAYPLNGRILTPWYYQSNGRVFAAPLATASIVAWGTDRGYLYLGRSDSPRIDTRLDARSKFLASPAYRQPYVYAATSAGDVYAVRETDGSLRWRLPTGYTIIRTPAVVGERVFVTTDQPALHCIDALTGAEYWAAPNVTQFAAASHHRIFGIDHLESLVVLDAATGDRLGSVPTYGALDALVNDQTDRLYLMSAEGLVRCLHELDAHEPFYHNQTPSDRTDLVAEPLDAETVDIVTPDAAAAMEGDPILEEDPPIPPQEPQPAEEQPFGVGDEDPFDLDF